MRLTQIRKWASRGRSV